MITYRLIKAAIKHNVVTREQLLFIALEAYGLNFRAAWKNLTEARKLEEALRFLGHPDTSELQKNRGVDLVLTCGLCDPCKVKANAVTYIRNAEDDHIDREFEKQEKELGFVKTSEKKPVVTVRQRLGVMYPGEYEALIEQNTGRLLKIWRTR